MDFMFEDEVDEVGSDVEAYCPKCKADTTHVVISKYEEEIRRVQCNPCGDVHSYRKPRGETEDDVPEPVSARKRAALKKLNWDEFFARKSQSDAKPYEFRERYRENLIVRHPKFGVGFVSEVVSDSKVEITFQDARRILVHNRRDIPGLPLAAEGDGVPTPPKSEKPEKASKPAKDAGGKAAKEAAAKESAAAKEPAAVVVKEAPTGKVAKPSKEAFKEAAKEPAAKPTLKLVAPPPPEKPAKAGPEAKAEHKVDHKAKPPAKAAKPAPAPAKPTSIKAVKPAARPASSAKPAKPTPKAAAPRGGSKSAAKPAAKKPAPHPKKKPGKKR